MGGLYTAHSTPQPQTRPVWGRVAGPAERRLPEQPSRCRPCRHRCSRATLVVPCRSAVSLPHTRFTIGTCRASKGQFQFPCTDTAFEWGQSPPAAGLRARRRLGAPRAAAGPGALEAAWPWRRKPAASSDPRCRLPPCSPLEDGLSAGGGPQPTAVPRQAWGGLTAE